MLGLGQEALCLGVGTGRRSQAPAELSMGESVLCGWVACGVPCLERVREGTVLCPSLPG